MEDSARTDVSSLIGRQGPFNRDEAKLLLDRGADLLARGEFAAAFQSYARVYGFDDPEVTAAAMLGAGQARYRMDDEAERGRDLGEDPRAARDAVDVLRLARDRRRRGPRRRPAGGDRRVPRGGPAGTARGQGGDRDRLGWLAKETGNVRASRRYFARGRAPSCRSSPTGSSGSPSRSR